MGHGFAVSHAPLVKSGTSTDALLLFTERSLSSTMLDQVAAS
jgi:hypothetical protein